MRVFFVPQVACTRSNKGVSLTKYETPMFIIVCLLLLSVVRKHILITGLFWVITRRVVAISYPEERSSQLLCGGSLKSRINLFCTQLPICIR